jgi:hypothetical protein
MQALAASKAGAIVKEMQIYPSSGKLVIGARVAKPADTDPAAGEWLYVSGALMPMPITSRFGFRIWRGTVRCPTVPRRLKSRMRSSGN